MKTAPTRRHLTFTGLGLGFGLVGGNGMAAATPLDLIRYDQFPSRHIEARTIWVWLPPGYAGSKRRYPVIYMHDGQNLFSPAYGFRGQEWDVDEAIADRTAKDPRNAAIVVGIANSPKRARDYAPTRIQERLSGAARARVERDNGGPPLGDHYLRMIVDELKPMIDQNFRTRPGRSDTILMGASRGGMISLYGLCEYPDVFGKAGCLSTHWLLVSAPQGQINPNLETPAIIEAHLAYFQDKLPRAGRHKVWMDRGSINLDQFYPPYQDAMDALFLRRNWVRGQHFESRVYDGADHNEAAWRTRLDDPLNFLWA